MIKQKTNHYKVKHWFYTIIGTFFYILSLRLFLIGNKIAAGGLSGAGIIINYFLDIKIGSIIILLNAPILLAAVYVNGWKYTLDTIIVAIIYSVGIDLLDFIPTIVQDPIAASIGGGVLYGAGMAMITLGNGSTGGTDLLSRLLIKKFPALSMGKMSIFIDGTIVILAMLAFKDVNVAIYPILTLYITAKTCDSILMGLVSGRMCMIITSKDPSEVACPLMKKTGRAVTLMEGRGMYSQSHRNVMIMALKPGEAHVLKEALESIDPQAFIVLLPATELIGGNFAGLPKP